MSDVLPMARKPDLTYEAVQEYAISLHKEGWDVSRLESGQGFKIGLTIDQEIRIITRGSNLWQISYITDGNSYPSGAPETLLQLEHAVGKLIGIKRPVYARAKEKQPASNLGRFVDLAQDRQVVAFFDPYLNNKALRVLQDLRSLGMQFDPAVKLLTSPKMVTKNEISSTFATMWFAETANAGEIRQVDGKPHKRFFLLRDGTALTFDFSIADPDKEGDIDVRDNGEDSQYFEQNWSSANAIP